MLAISCSGSEVRRQCGSWEVEVTALPALLACQGFGKSWYVSACPSVEFTAEAFLWLALAKLDRACEVWKVKLLKCLRGTSPPSGSLAGSHCCSCCSDALLVRMGWYATERLSRQQKGLRPRRTLLACVSFGFADVPFYLLLPSLSAQSILGVSPCRLLSSPGRGWPVYLLTVPDIGVDIPANTLCPMFGGRSLSVCAVFSKGTHTQIQSHRRGGTSRREEHALLWNVSSRHGVRGETGSAGAHGSLEAEYRPARQLTSWLPVLWICIKSPQLLPPAFQTPFRC